MERTSYQNGWIRELARESGVGYKLCWREKDKNGKWKEKARTMPREIDGKPVVKKDAQAALDRILADVNSRNGVTPDAITGMTFNKFLEDKWGDYVERNRLRDSTLDGYNSILEQWIKPYFGDMLVTRITKDAVSVFFKELRGEKLSSSYQKNIYSLLSKIFDIAVAFDYVQFSPVNPTLHRPHVVREEKHVLPLDKMKAFFEALSDVWRVVITVLLLTGLRQGELLGLRWMDIDFDNKKICKRNVVFRGKLKVGIKDTARSGAVARKHEIGMSPLVEQQLKLRMNQTTFVKPADYVFSREDGRPLDPDHIRRYVLYPAMEKVGIPMAAHGNGLHMFRHTVVSALAKCKGLVAAQHQVGHSNIATTANIYTHIDSEQQLDSAVALQDAFAAHLLPVVSAASVN